MRKSRNTPNPLRATDILAGLAPANRGHIYQLDVLEQIDSTNRYLNDHSAPAHHNLVCIANQQTQGRGRRGNTWISPPDSNIYLSLRWWFDNEPADMGCLSLACGISIVRALEGLGLNRVRLKWPNDIYTDQYQKLGGILIECRATSRLCVIGIGLNYCMPAEAGQGIDQQWASLADFGAVSSRHAVIVALLNQLVPMLHDYPCQGFAPMRSHWERYDLLHQQPVIAHGTPPTQGVAIGINAEGALRIHTPDGIKTVYADEVSLRRQFDPPS
jgi:BirA family transcriptional regulator, biotin operon repressor / biotin---[acetyl-CoA-carboxylase] ligase